DMNGADILFEALKTGVAALAILCMYKVCIELIRKNGA
ncbi:unnamed protein product, partial [marine sediment metagenome]